MGKGRRRELRNENVQKDKEEERGSKEGKERIYKEGGLGKRGKEREWGGGG